MAFGNMPTGSGWPRTRDILHRSYALFLDPHVPCVVRRNTKQTGMLTIFVRVPPFQCLNQLTFLFTKYCIDVMPLEAILTLYILIS
jgi:hypothetical protein